MHFLRIVGLLFLPALLHAGFVNIQFSAGCACPSGAPCVTVTASSGSAICSGPDTGLAQAQGGFGSSGASGFALAYGTLDRSITFHADVSIEAVYQITFSGPIGPGYLEPTICVAHDSSGGGSASLITPNGSVSWSGVGFNSCSPPTDIPIVFGVPLDVHLSLHTDASAFCCGVSGQGTGQVYLSYQTLDAAKNPVSATADIVIPEPSTMQLWAIGACLILLRGLLAAGSCPVTSWYCRLRNWLA